MEIEKKLGYLKRGKKVISDDEIVSIKIIKNAKIFNSNHNKEYIEDIYEVILGNGIKKYISQAGELTYSDYYKINYDDENENVLIQNTLIKKLEK